MLLCFTPFWFRKVFRGILYSHTVGYTSINTGNCVNQVQPKSECHKLRNGTGQMPLISSSALLRFQINHSYFFLLIHCNFPTQDPCVPAGAVSSYSKGRHFVVLSIASFFLYHGSLSQKKIVSLSLFSLPFLSLGAPPSVGQFKENPPLGPPEITDTPDSRAHIGLQLRYGA